MYWKFVEALRNQGATNVEILLVLIALMGFVLFFILRYTWERRTVERQQRRGAFRSFLNTCREKSLPTEEVNLLLNHSKMIGEEVDASLVKSNMSFDRFAQRVIQTATGGEIPRVNSNLTRLRNRLGFRPPSRGLALSSTRELPPGQVLYLVLSADIFLVGRIVNVDETMLSVRLRAGTPRAQLDPNMQVNVHFNRSGDARYSGSCQILRTASDELGQHVILSHSDELRRDQRRQDYRIDENRTISLWVMDEQLQEADDPFHALGDLMPERALLEDLSGGGASIIFQRSLPLNHGAFVNLDPAATYGLPIVRGTVIRANRRMRTDRWALSVRFEDLRPSEHQKIVSHVFTKERESLKTAQP